MTTATLTLSRKWGGLIGRTKEWQVLVDRNVVGSIVTHQRVEFPLEPGHHTLQIVQSHRHLSPERSFEVAQGQGVEFWCRGQMLWPMFLVALIKPDLWITLKAG